MLHSLIIILTTMLGPEPEYLFVPHNRTTFQFRYVFSIAILVNSGLIQLVPSSSNF